MSTASASAARPAPADQPTLSQERANAWVRTRVSGSTASIR
ncbi:hypothetical protein O7635_34805 [Asanoa sp. WMMD1127]|nr:hypothetical protein [Asanoa sp. WMMD1127]MDG4827045.1 hypothetical protein [Asanoa sp. WMMD1127]